MKIDRAKKRAAMLTRYRAVFESEDGKEVLNDLMKVGKVIGDTFDPDPYVHAYNEGARSIVLRILTTIQTNPERFAEMLKGQLEENYEI